MGICCGPAPGVAWDKCQWDNYHHFWATHLRRPGPFARAFGMLARIFGLR